MVRLLPQLEFSGWKIKKIMIHLSGKRGGRDGGMEGERRKESVERGGRGNEKKRRVDVDVK